jgi:hypothetical protein
VNPSVVVGVGACEGGFENKPLPFPLPLPVAVPKLNPEELDIVLIPSEPPSLSGPTGPLTSTA